MTVQDDEQLAARAVEAGAYEEALRALLPLAERNSEYALLTVGWIYETGAIGLPDKEAAQTYYERAAANGTISAYLNLGWLLLEKGQEMQARAAFETGAKLGNGECESALVRFDDNRIERLAGQAIEKGSHDKAARLLKPLAERNSEYALLGLGWLYETGALGDVDKKKARSYFERAAANGSASACFDLGRLLLSQHEESQARSAFETGAERGDVPSMSELGRMMVEGRGGPCDVGAGSTWLQNAAAQGHIFAKRTLLDIDYRNTHSMFERLLIGLRIVSLAIRGGKEMFKDPHSNKVR
jgi:TPR repeat protein